MVATGGLTGTGMGEPSTAGEGAGAKGEPETSLSFESASPVRGLFGSGDAEIDSRRGCFGVPRRAGPGAGSKAGLIQSLERFSGA